MNDLNFKIGAQLDNGIDAKIQKQLSNVKGLHLNVDDVTLSNNALSKIQSALDNSKVNLNIRSNLNESGLKSQGQQLGQSIGKQISGGINNNITRLNLQKINVKSNIDQFLATNTKLTGELRNRFLELKTAIDSVDDNKSLANLKTQLSTLKNEAKSTGMIGKSLGDTFKENFSSFANWFGIGTLVAGSVRKVITSFNELKEIDTILTEVSKTSDRTASSLKRLGDTSFDVASTYGQKASDYLKGVQEMSRAGFSETGSESLAKLSTLAQSAGDMTSELANQYLIASDAAYGYGGDVAKLNALLDSQNQITNRNAVNMSELAEATKIVASQASQSGVAENELTAALSTMIATTQQGGDIAARAFKGILMNLQQVSGELDGEVIDEDSFKKVEDRLHSVGVAMEEVSNGAAVLRNPIKILDDLAKVYNSLPDNSADKAGIIADLGGKYRGGQLSALLANWDKYYKILGDYDNAQGSALDEAMKTADSWDGLLNSIENNWSEFVNIFVTDNGVTSILRTVKEITGGFNELVKTLGSIPTVAIGAGTFAFIKNFDNFKNLGTASNALREFNSVAQLSTTSYSSLANVLKMVDNQTKINIVSQSALTTEQKLMALQTAGLTTAELNTVISTNALSASQVGATATTGGLSLALKGLWATMMANPILAVGMVLTAGVSIWSKYKQSVEETRQTTQDAANTFSDSSASIQDYADKYKILHDELINANITEERQHEIKSQLLSLQKELNEKYGDEHGRLNLVTDAYKDQTEAIKALNVEAAKKYLLENREGIDSATRKMEQDRTYSLGSTGAMSNDYAKQLFDIVSKYQEQGVQLEQFNAGSETGYTIKFTGDAKQADEVIHKLASQVQDLQKEFGDNNFIQSFLDNSSNALKENNKVLDKYREIYDSSLMAQIASDDKLSEGYNSATIAVKNYNDAVSSGDEGKIASARKNIEDVKKSIDLAGDDWKRYGLIMNDVFNQADTKLYDFEDKVKTNQDGLMGFSEKLRGLSAEDLLSMDNDGRSDNFDKLVSSADEYGLSAEDVIAVLQRLNIIQGKVAESGKNVFSPISKQEAIANVNSLSEGFESLDKIMNSMQGKNPFDYSLLDDDKFKSNFDKLGDSYANFIEKISSSPKDVKGAQSAFNDLVTEWLDNSEALEGLTEDNAGLTTAMLKNMGVANAEEVVANRLTVAQERLSAQKAYTVDMSDALTNATASEIPKLIDEATQSDVAKVAIAGLALEKANVNGTTLDTSGDIENVISLIGVIGTASTALQNYNKLKSGQIFDVETQKANRDSLLSGGFNPGQLGQAAEQAKQLSEYNKRVDAAKAEAQKEVDAAIKAARGYKGKGTNVNTSYSGGTKTNKASGSGSKKEKEAFKTDIDWIEILIDRADEKVQKLQDRISDASNYKSKNTLTDTAIDEMSNKVTALEATMDSYQKKADSYNLAPSYIDKIKNGTMEIETITDETVSNNIKSYQEWYNKAEEVRKQIDETKKSMKELAQSKLDNVINDFESLVSLSEKYSSFSKSLLDLQKNLGQEISNADYENLISQQKGIYNQLESEYNSLSKELSKAVSSGAIKTGTDEWRKYREELININSEMNDTVSSMNDFRQAMIDLSFDSIKDFANTVDRINNSVSAMIDVMGSDGLMQDSMITSKGLAQIALYGQQYANAKQQAAEYANAIEAVNEMYENGSLTQSEYNDKLSEYTSAQLAAVKATKEAESAILQFRYDAIQAQIDDMNKLVDAKKKALQSEKDYQDYLDSINGKQSDINNLQAKINELSNSTDRQDIAQRYQLEKQLSDAKKELADTQAEYTYDQQLNALDKEAENYANAKTTELDELKSSYDKQQKVISDYLSDVKNKYSTVYKTLTEYGANYNIATTSDLTSPWESASSAVDTFQSVVSDAIAQINVDIASIDLSSLTELVSMMGGASGGLSDSGFEDVTGSGTWQKTSKGWWYGSSNDDYVSDGIYTIGGKQYSFNEDGYMKSGWDDSSGEWRYFEPENGQMVKSTWRDYKGKQYYLKSDGTMATDMAIKAKNGSGYYYVNDDGVWDGNTLSYDEVKRRNITVGYTSGTTSARSGLAYMDEDGIGSELIRDNTGTIMQFDGGETVFNSGMTKTLWDFADSPSRYISNAIAANLPTLDTTKFISNGSGVMLNIASPLVTIEGGLDSTMKDYVTDLVNGIPGKIVEQMNSAYKTKGTQR